MRRGLRSLTVATLAVVLVGGGKAEAQMVTLDEGTFRVFVDDQAVGTEAFSIRRSGSGVNAQVIATGEVRLQLPEGRLELRPALQLSGTTELAVSAYQIRVSGHREEEIFVTLGDRRFLTSVRSERGEQERELRAAPGTFLLDTDVAHQYYVLAQRSPAVGASVPVIVPRDGGQHDLRITDIRATTIAIAGQEVPATLWRLEGDRETRELWTDDEGRVLAVHRPASSYRAVRERIP